MEESSAGRTAHTTSTRGFVAVIDERALAYPNNGNGMHLSAATSPTPAKSACCS
jgi:hypothetical protein